MTDEDFKKIIDDWVSNYQLEVARRSFEDITLVKQLIEGELKIVYIPTMAGKKLKVTVEEFTE